MRILVIGTESHFAEFTAKFGTHHQYTHVAEHRYAEKSIDNQEIIFDFIIDEEPDQFSIYANRKTPVFLNTTKISIAEILQMTNLDPACAVFGFNGIPTFINRKILECSMWRASDRGKLDSICTELGTEVMVVDDRVGLVTPRVVAMIINEAYYTVQEGTATRNDIDMAMKLGTNYPYGPFEWTSLIGIQHVYEILEAVYDDTHDERYKICPLLKKEYLSLP